ncbi:rod-binding protein [Salipiger bermudensis]|uniref:rod-binding protein n=1 Tax=Salipiger bermudensis TaxID=344736 RepID=UPI001C999B1D|nr:rod-binding protein [Salipiger bermudensis]MBY6003901.1 rod-binding protein [Salipiger bermudensis]
MDISSAPTPGATAHLYRAAVALEASFLAEMLRAAGLGESRGAFGGGVGEDQFASLLAREHAEALASSGGIGLAESIFQALARRQHD